MRIPLILYTSLLFVACKPSIKDLTPKDKVETSHKVLEGLMLREHMEFEQKLDSLYEISDTNAQKALLLADHAIASIADSLKKSGHFKHHIEELHYLKGEIFYKLGMHKKSLSEFCMTPINGYLGIASNYMKLKMTDSAYSILLTITPGHYLHDFSWANYYEMVGQRDSAIKLYKGILMEKWIYNGNYDSLKIWTKIRLKANITNGLKLNNMYFPTNNPKTKDNY